MNKKGEGISNVIILIFFLFIILVGGLALAFGGMAIKWVFDTAVPEFSGIGMVGNTNVSSISNTVATPINNIVQSFTWFSGVIYILALLGLIGLSVGFRITGNKWLMGFFVACIFMLLIASIFISNIYETFYNDGGDVGAGLHEFGMLSFFVLYSPLIMCIIGFVCGIVMFSGIGDEEGQYG